MIFEVCGPRLNRASWLKYVNFPLPMCVASLPNVPSCLLSVDVAPGLRHTEGSVLEYNRLASARSPRDDDGGHRRRLLGGKQLAQTERRKRPSLLVCRLLADHTRLTGSFLHKHDDVYMKTHETSAIPAFGRFAM